MAPITEHQHDDLNKAITITPDKPGEFGAPNRYILDWKGADGLLRALGISFQAGAVGEVGVNGVSCEALIMVMLHRLRGFQDGPMRCAENAEVIHHLEQALVHCVRRSERRIAAGVKGTA